jgi:hypothetical protein
MTPSSTTLVRRAIVGDEKAWEDLVIRYGGLLRAIARDFRLSQEQASDAAQNTWMRLVESIGKVREPEKLGGWPASTMRRSTGHPSAGVVAMIAPVLVPAMSSKSFSVQCPARRALDLAEDLDAEDTADASAVQRQELSRENLATVAKSPRRRGMHRAPRALTGRCADQRRTQSGTGSPSRRAANRSGVRASPPCSATYACTRASGLSAGGGPWRTVVPSTCSANRTPSSWGVPSVAMSANLQ